MAVISSRRARTLSITDKGIWDFITVAASIEDRGLKIPDRAFGMIQIGLATGLRLGQNRNMSVDPTTTEDSGFLSARWRFRAALILAMAADALQIFVLPLFAEGAFSPAEDVLDVLVALGLIQLVGWHWEFLPAFAAELVPGVDLVPFWSLAVASVYRKWKAINVAVKETNKESPALEGEIVGNR